MCEQLIDRYVVRTVAEMRSLARLLAGACRTCDCSHMNLIVDESCSCKRKRRKLNCSRETSRVGNIMSLEDLLSCALAKTVHELTSRIIAVESEVIAKVDDSA